MRVLTCGWVFRRVRRPGRKNLTRGRWKLKRCTKRMTDVKLAILRTFEATVKALLSGDGDLPLETSTSMGQICDHLQNIRHELSEVKVRLAHIEQHHRTNIIIDGGNKGSLWQDDTCAGVDDEDLESNSDDIHAAFIGAPIPLKQVEESALVRPVTPPVLPDIEPPAVTTNDALPDIVDKKSKNSMDIEGESDNEEEEDAEDEDADADADADADVEGEAAADEDDEGLALEEITFKGKIYYKDSENTVYILDENEDLSDPIGVWNEITKTVRFFAKK